MEALSEWGQKIIKDPLVLRIGIFGSYASQREGVGSDLDAVIIVKRSNEPFERRGAFFYPLDFPVPVDLLVYTEEEWKNSRKKAEG